ncbi:MAG: hypothetical protein HKN09_07140 [Saprospiraceae bacterium]|nr:hypothetical protein [Saprospiraceae bacterium]
MMVRKLQYALCLIAILATSQLFSQKSLIKAERQFELKAFELAIESAKQALEKEPTCVDCKYIIAESLRMMNENIDAAYWYSQLETETDLPLDFHFNYGLLLKRMGEYEQAKTHFNNYAVHDAIKAEHFVASCDFAIKSLSAPHDFELNLYAPSSKQTDFGPTVYKDKLVFCSFRDNFKRDLRVENSSMIQDEKCQLFISGMGFTGDVNNTQFLLKDEDETYDMGPIHYASEAPIVAVTRNNFRDGEKQIFSNDLELTLYLAYVNEDGSFTNIKPFPYNEVGYATGFGTLNPTGKILYFASNRPGGYGGFDLYVSFYKNGKWTYPDNLGPTINTEGNEITPFFDGEQLYFSSDFHVGLGGYDVFKAFVDYGKWTTPENMLNGVNSPEDDYYFIKHPSQESYYLTSNRLGGRGYHDIYLVHQAPEAEMLAAELITPPAVDLQKDVEESEVSNVETQFVNYSEETFEPVNVEFDAAIPAAVPIPEASEESTEATDIVVEHNNEVESATAVLTSEEELSSRKEENLIDFDSYLEMENVPEAMDISKHMVANVSLVGAKRVASGELILDHHSNVYFIQLAALFKSKANMGIFSTLTKYGSLYKVQQSNATKVKLGYFKEESQAKNILQKVKNLGYADAFITYENLDPTRIELVTISDDANLDSSNTGFVTDYTTGRSYKVRLASYSDPKWFETDRVNDLGIIEQWSKGEWTIFVLGGYRNQDEANKAKLIAKMRGFKDAEVVMDNHGILQKIGD